MKKIFSLTIILSMLIAIGCKKQEEAPKEGPIATKYATLRVATYKDKDLKEWQATLEKAEEVSLLEEFDQKKNNKTIKIAKIKLASDEIAYMKARFLADKPIVFIDDTAVFVRPIASSRKSQTISRGTIAFITNEKGNWKEIWAKTFDGKYIVNKWVENGFSYDPQILRDAIDYDQALTLLEKEKQDEKEKGKEILDNLSTKESLFAEMAKSKINELQQGAPETPAEPETPEPDANSELNTDTANQE